MHAPEVPRDHYWKSWSVPWEGAAVVPYRDETPDPVPCLMAGTRRARHCGRRRSGDDTASVIPIQITGDPATRFSLVVLGDGYMASEQAKFRAHLDRHLNILWSIEPFRSYRNYFNVYAVEIVSAQSGIDCDPEIRERRTTPLQLRFGGGCTNINARGVTVPSEANAIVMKYATLATPHRSDSDHREQRYLRRDRRPPRDDDRRQRAEPAHHASRVGALAWRAHDDTPTAHAACPGGTYSGDEPTPIHTTS